MDDNHDLLLLLLVLIEWIETHKTVMCKYSIESNWRTYTFIHTGCRYSRRHIIVHILRNFENLPFNSNQYTVLVYYNVCVVCARKREHGYDVSGFLFVNRFYLIFVFNLQASKRWHSIVKYIYIHMRIQNGE